MILYAQSYGEHHGGRRHQGQGGVHQVDEIIFYHVLHHFGLVFDKKSIKMILYAQSYGEHHGGCRHQGQGGVHQKVNI